MQDEAQRSAAGEGGSTATTSPPATDTPTDATTATAPEAASVEEAPTYGAYYYDRLIGDYEVSGRYEYEGVWKEFFRVMAHHIVTRFQPHKTLDAGCAKGFLIRALREHHVDAFGVDASEYAISQADDSIKDYVRVGSITEDLGGPYDLISCIEVIEHLPDSEIELAIERLCAATDRILFSSTPHDFVEPSHLSVKLPEDWVALFAKQGFYRNFTIDTSFLTPWACVFERLPAGDSSLAIREYDRAWQRQRTEIDELRQTVIKFSTELDELHAGIAPELTEVQAERDELDAQFKELQDLHEDLQQRHVELAKERDDIKLLQATDRMELLRLRDLLIGKERELGGIRGRITELESELKQFGKLPEMYKGVVESTTWKIAWKVFSPYRNLRHKQIDSGNG
jgi:hypothetical protein